MAEGGGVMLLTAQPWSQMNAIRLPNDAGNRLGDGEELWKHDGSSLVGLLDNPGSHADCTVLCVPASERGELRSVPAHLVLLRRDPRFAIREGAAAEVSSSTPELQVDSDSIMETLAPLYGSPGHQFETRQHLLAVVPKSPLHSGEAAEVYGAVDPHVDGTVRTSCGAIFPVHRSILGYRCEWFDAGFRHNSTLQSTTAAGAAAPAFMDPAAAVVLDGDLGSGPDFVDFVPRLLAYLYTKHATELDALLTAEHVVTAAFAGDLLLVPEMKEAALRLMRESIDSENVCSLLRVAMHLDDSSLRRKCLEFTVANFRDVAESPYFDAVIRSNSSAETAVAELQHLATVAVSNPLCRGAPLSDAEEFLAMIREALEELRQRHSDSVERQDQELAAWSEEHHSCRMSLCLDLGEHFNQEEKARLEQQMINLEARRVRLQRVSDNIQAQGLHVQSLAAFLANQEAIFSIIAAGGDPDAAKAKVAAAAETAAAGTSSRSGQAEMTASPPNHPGGGSGGTTREGFSVLPASDLPFGYDWQEVRREDHVTPGLEITMNLDTGHRMARIPPTWRLQIWVSTSSRFVRCDVSRSTSIQQITAAVAESLGVDASAVDLVDKAAISQGPISRGDLNATAEDLRLFDRRRHLDIVLR